MEMTAVWTFFVCVFGEIYESEKIASIQISPKPPDRK